MDEKDYQTEQYNELFSKLNKALEENRAMSDNIDYLNQELDKVSKKLYRIRSVVSLLNYITGDENA